MDASKAKARLNGNMRAVRILAPNHSELAVVECPVPAPGEVLVKVAAAGICGSDIEVLRGTRPAPYVRYPIVPGHEWAGTVVEVSDDVQSVRPGNRVVAEGFRACGRCDRCQEGRTNLCTAGYAETGFTHAGAFADFIAVPAPRVHRLPDDADLEAAALLEPAACVAQGLLEVGFRPGLKVAIVGAGTLGLLATLLLRLSSPSELVVFGTRSDRLEVARRLGATGTVLVNGDVISEEWNGGFDLVFEAASRSSGATAALSLARRGGTVILEGISGDRNANIVSDAVSLKHLRVQGVFGSSHAAWSRVVGLFSSGLLDPKPLITHRFALQEHHAAFAAVEEHQGHTLKVLLQP